MAKNSSSHQPAPMPSVRRPFDRKSIVARIFAVSTAGRCGTTITEVTMRSFVVAAAMKAALRQLLVPVDAAAPEGNSPLRE